MAFTDSIVSASGGQRDPAAGINSCIQETLFSGDMSDVSFAVGGGEFGNVKFFPAHKYIVSIRSTEFYTMFYGSVPEKGPQVDITDCTPDAFENMLRYMYTDTVDKDKFTMDNVFPTLRCADKYDLPQLAVMCLGFVTTQLNADNALDTLQRAIQWCAEDIVETCLQLVDLQSDVILNSEQFTTIAQDTLKMILQRGTISAEEYAIYLAVESGGL
ncbi:BTB/POZ domain-containing protein 3-like isoform X2 [Paramacrobiotus metropolitanus]|uniref:BTB/POZ domain-containing protein 3-like isoform X2 n=1 Tax=Paramacrobiotus metropolitanus TaxID=2943436 RepID=UPI0024458F8B|nr:BTB/POZ domain-containing protein 3-like isoform X2 [Paramacrobiotus metropolitanus]